MEKDPFEGEREDVLQGCKGGNLFGLIFVFAVDEDLDQGLVLDFERDVVVRVVSTMPLYSLDLGSCLKTCSESTSKQASVSLW